LLRMVPTMRQKTDSQKRRGKFNPTVSDLVSLY